MVVILAELKTQERKVATLLLIISLHKVLMIQ